MNETFLWLLSAVIVLPFTIRGLYGIYARYKLNK